MQPPLPLRDIHLPAEPGWWPPAPGWWVLGLLIVAALLWGTRRLIARWRRAQRARARQRLLTRELARLGQSSPPAGQAQAAALALRAAALQERPDCRNLRGEEWLLWLDRGLVGAPFSKGPGRLLLDAPYRPRLAASDAEALLAVTRQRLSRDFE